MKDDEPEVHLVADESPPMPETHATGLPLIFDTSSSAPPPDAAGTLTLKWFYARCVTRMRCSGCPLASLCGQDLAHDIYLLSQKTDLTEIKNIEAWTSTVITKRAYNKKRDCHCDSKVPFVEAGDMDEDDEEENRLISALPLSKYQADALTPEQDFMAARLLKTVLSLLSPEERRLFILVRWEGRPEQEVATILGIKYPAARKRVERLNKKLEGIFRALTL